MLSPVISHPIRRLFGNQRVLILPAMLLGIGLTACGGPDQPVGVVGHVEGFGGMVVSDEPRASMVGRDVLSAGGTPADAAVAMAFTLAVTLPSQAGVGAGGVCLVHDKETAKTEVLDFLPRPPSVIGNGASRPTNVPGLPRGMYALSAKYGRLRWEALLTPAERMARLGEPVSRALALQLGAVAGELFNDPESRDVFAKPGGVHLDEGDSLIQSDLGATISRFRSKGVGDFYSGPWASDLVTSVNSAGGSLTAEDLRNFIPTWREPIAVPYGDDTAFFPTPSPAAGLLEAQLWSILAHDGAYASASAEERPHLLAEAFARAYGDRDRWMRPDGTPVQEVSALLGKERLQALMSGYSRTSHSVVQGDLPSEMVAGTGFAAIDKAGNAVVCNISLNNSFGIGRIAPNFGFFPAAATGAQGLGPHNLGPILAINTNSNEFRFAAATGGGATGPTALIQSALIALIDGKNAGEAVAAKRVHANAAPDIAFVEQGSTDAEPLRKAGHEVREVFLPSRVNAIKCTSGSPRLSNCSTASDPRGNGLALTVGQN